jgi:hypothetical protein
MSNPVAVLRRWTSPSTGTSGQNLLVWCPGCAAANEDRGLHAVEVDAAAPPPVWTWDGDLDAPTISPSILVSGPPMDPQDILLQPGVCHSYIRAGRWQFLGDCSHPLVGQTVDLLPLPDWVCR